jgi:hypothetical protein
MRDSLEQDDPWSDTSVSDVKSEIDTCLRKNPGGQRASGRVLVPRFPGSRIFIKETLLDVLKDKGQQTKAKEILEYESLGQVFSRFLKKDPWWVIRCDVTDSMVSSRWGLQAFVLKDRGYIYYLPDDECTEEAATLPIFAAWEPVKHKTAYSSAVLTAYVNHWEEALLPPYVGQWASGPFDVMLAAVSEILTRCPDNWPIVLDRLQGHDRRNTSLAKLAQKTSLKMGLRQDEVKEILLPYTSTEPAKGKLDEDLSKKRKRVLVGAFLCLIDWGT